MPRAAKFDASVLDQICSRISEGESLVSICRDEKMPHYATVARWLDEKADFRERYARARELQADYIVDEVVLIADTEKDANTARVRIDARKWVAAKLRPKKYGDKLELGGPDGGPIQVQIIEFEGT